MHYMVHYPSQVYRFGPLITTWTMRYEAKLNVLKKASRHRNFKNICYTVSKRHQHLLCYHLNCKSLLYKELTHGKSSLGNQLIHCEKELKDCVLNVISNVSHYDLVYSTAWVNCKQMHLKVNMFVLVRTDGLYPVFGKIVSIYLIGCHCFVKIIIFETMCFDDMYQAFVVKATNNCEFLYIEAIPVHPVYLRRAFDSSNHNLYISTKMYIEL